MWLGLIINSTLFFRGCSLSDAHFTTGFPWPAVEYQQDMNQTLWQSGQVRLLAGPMVWNLACFLLLSLVVWYTPPLRGWISNSLLMQSLLVTYFAFNCVVVSPTIWVDTTFALQTTLVEWLLGDERRVWVMDIFSRAYFTTFVGGAAVLIGFGRHLWRTRIATPNGNRWQVQLVGLFVLTTLAGLAAAMIHRLMANG